MNDNINTRPAQEPEINEADGEPIFHADEEEGEDHEYKKFSIPKPEGDEEIATPATQAQGAGIGPFSFKATAPETPIALKAGGAAGHGTQERIDQLAAAATKKSAGAFKKAFGPVLKIIEKAESLEELRDMMEDEKAVASLFGEMDISDVEELLQKVMLYADLEGRSLEDGRD